MSKTKTLKINVLAQYCGTVEIPIPDNIDTSDENALKNYVHSIWDDVSLPEMQYVPYSDEPDWDGHWSVSEFEVKQMKLIDVFNMMVEQKIKKDTMLLIVTPSGKEYKYEYDNWYFVDDYARGISYMLDINVDTLQYEAKLVEQKEKEYLIKINVKGLKEDETYLKYYTSQNVVALNAATQTRYAKSHFTKSEMQSIKPVKEFLEDMEDKYELIEVNNNEDD